jgi:hypothetical protein
VATRGRLTRARAFGAPTRIGTSTEIILTALRSRASGRHTAAQLLILLEESGIFFREGGLFVKETVEMLIIRRQLVLEGRKLPAKLTVSVRRKGGAVVGRVVPTLLKSAEDSIFSARARPRIRELKA